MINTRKAGGEGRHLTTRPASASGGRSHDAQTLRKKRAAVELLAADNARLKDELDQESRYLLNPTSHSAKKLINSLEEQDRVYERLIAEQQHALERLFLKQARLHAHVEEQRESMGGINRALEVSIRAQRRVILLENRLEHASSAHSGAQLAASELKQQVQGLRRERCLFEELTAKTQSGIESKAEEISGVLKKIFEAHEAMNRADAMSSQVLAQKAKDVAEAEGEWHRLTKIIEADRHRRAFEQAQRAAERKTRMETLLRGMTDCKHRFARRTRKKRGKLSSKNADNHAIERQHESQTISKSASKAFGVEQPPSERLRHVDGILAALASRINDGKDSPETLVQRFKELRQRCFRLFESLTQGYARLNDVESELEAGRAALRSFATADDVQSGETSSLGTCCSSIEYDQIPRNVSLTPENKLALSRSAPSTTPHVPSAQAATEKICAQVRTICERLQDVSPEIGAALKNDGPPSETTLLHYLGLLEHWASSAIEITGSGVIRATAVGGSTALPWMTVGSCWKDNSDENEIACIDPPSVEMSETSSMRSRSAGAGGRGGMESKHSRRSVTESEGGGGMLRTPARALDLQTLTNRAKRAAEARMATATAAAVRVHVE